MSRFLDRRCSIAVSPPSSAPLPGESHAIVEVPPLQLPVGASSPIFAGFLTSQSSHAEPGSMAAGATRSHVGDANSPDAVWHWDGMCWSGDDD